MTNRPPDWLLELVRQAAQRVSVAEALARRRLPPPPPAFPMLLPPLPPIREPGPLPPPPRRLSSLASHFMDAAVRSRVILRQSFDVVDARVVPRSESVPFGNSGKLVETAVLYADLRGSTELGDRHRRVTVAKILKVFLTEMARVARFHGAHVRGFAGDRIMVVFEQGEGTSTKAVDVAAAMRDVVRRAINPELRAATGEEVSAGIGIDYGLMLAVRAGMPRNPDLSDLVWAGNPANFASKLTDAADPEQILVSEAVYSRLDFNRYQRGWWTPLTATIAGQQRLVYGLDPTVSFAAALEEAGLS